MTFYLMNATITKDLGDYEREADALAVVRALVDRFGDGHADDLVLATDEEDGTALAGAELLQMLRDARFEHETAGAGRVVQRGA